MILLNERNQVKQAIEDWCSQYGLSGTHLLDKRGRKVGEELMAMDPETATSDEVAEIIGSTVWVQKKTCDECGKDSWDCVELGEEPAFCETRTAIVCKDCLKAAIRLFGDEIGV